MRRLEELLAVYPARQVVGDRAQMVAQIMLDSRAAGPHTLFVARRGTKHDGLAYVRDAYDRGCRIIASDRMPPMLPEGCTFILADDLLGALAQWSHALYGFPSMALDVYGVTGTNGKTTTTFLLAHLLGGCQVPAGIIGTLGAEWNGHQRPTRHTTPEAPELADMLDWLRQSGCQAVAMEVSSHALWWRRVEGIRFAGAVFTNLTADHLDFHRTMDNYARAKKRLFDMLPPDAVAVVWSDSEWSDLMTADTKASTVCKVGRDWNANVRICDEQLGADGSRWRLVWDDGHTLELAMPLVGSFNVENASLAVVLLAARGYELDQLAERLRTAYSPPGRMERYHLPNGVTALVDYAHTPDALERVLRGCRKMMSPQARLICVFGCGGDRDQAKRPLMGALAVSLADQVILTSDNPRSEDPARIIADIRAGIDLVHPAKRRAVVEEIPDRAAAITAAITAAQPGDWVLVAGKGHEDYQIIGTERVSYSDRALLASYLCVSKT
ncbi:MAG: UDP-N-acetylmuramoyl-L-alanyl-D-glutamate--2,6-diaminopimelate ligase [Candidatus Kapaibacterium sp.]|nr:MAG: UDP-N-acetylmuramoyl-L-alanyl-D-glutamate--2,6-diaminopimelate ligase [Candidatus Kapabacteria bacterium]